MPVISVRRSHRWIQRPSRRIRIDTVQRMKCRLSIAKWACSNRDCCCSTNPTECSAAALICSEFLAHCRKGNLVILASHHVSRVLKIWNRAIILHQGRMTFNAPRQQPWLDFDQAFREFLPHGEVQPLHLSRPAQRFDFATAPARQPDYVFLAPSSFSPSIWCRIELEMAPGLLWLAFLFTGTLGLPNCLAPSGRINASMRCCFRLSTAARSFWPKCA